MLTDRTKPLRLTYNFKVLIEPDEDFDGNPRRFHAHCPALDALGGATWGATEDEALKNMNEAIHMIVEELIQEGRAIPEGPEVCPAADVFARPR